MLTVNFEFDGARTSMVKQLRLISTPILDQHRLFKVAYAADFLLISNSCTDAIPT